MQAPGPDESRFGAAERRPPSARSRACLADGVRREVADARARLEEATLRAETHRLLGNDGAAADAAREQQAILADVEARLGRVVSSAVVQRDAEQVLADATRSPHVARSPRDVPAPAPAELRPRTPMLAGMASLLAVVALSAAAVLGLTGRLDTIEVVGAASSREVHEPTPAPTGPQQAPPTRRPAPLDGAPSGDAVADDPTADADDDPTEDPTDPTDEAPSATVAAPDGAHTTAPTAPTSPPGEVAAAGEVEEGDAGLDQVVSGLIDAVDDLDGDRGQGPGAGPSGTETPTVDEDVAGPDLQDLVEDVVPDVPDSLPGGDPDGFVPAPSAQ